MSLDATSNTELYGYVPTEWVCILFVVLFSLSTSEFLRCFSANAKDHTSSLEIFVVAHLAQALRSRLPWLIFTIVPGGLLEILGWSGRLWNAINPLIL